VSQHFWWLTYSTGMCPMHCLLPCSRYSKRCRLETRLRRDRGLIDTRETKRSSDALSYVPRLRGPSILDSAARYRDIGQDGRLAERYSSLAPSPFTLEEPSSDRNKRRNAGHISDGVTSVRQVFEIRKTAESREKIDAGCTESVRAACRDSSGERERERERERNFAAGIRKT